MRQVALGEARDVRVLLHKRQSTLRVKWSTSLLPEVNPIVTNYLTGSDVDILIAYPG